LSPVWTKKNHSKGRGKTSRLNWGSRSPCTVYGKENRERERKKKASFFNESERKKSHKTRVKSGFAWTQSISNRRKWDGLGQKKGTKPRKWEKKETP